MMLYYGSAGHLCLSLTLTVMRSVCHFSLSFLCGNIFCFTKRNMCLVIVITNSVFISTVQAFLSQLVCNLLDEGNTVFREGDWRQAAVHYSEGVNVARYAQSEALVIPPELLESLYVNRAAAHYSLVSAYVMSCVTPVILQC